MEMLKQFIAEQWASCLGGLLLTELIIFMLAWAHCKRDSNPHPRAFIARCMALCAFFFTVGFVVLRLFETL